MENLKNLYLLLKEFFIKFYNCLIKSFQSRHKIIDKSHIVKGKVPIKYEENKFYKIRNRVTLRICRLSKNKPFCDGIHVKAKFKDE
jgi:CDGSH-type Zn-finger protein